MGTLQGNVRDMDVESEAEESDTDAPAASFGSSRPDAGPKKGPGIFSLFKYRVFTEFFPLTLLCSPSVFGLDLGLPTSTVPKNSPYNET